MKEKRKGFISGVLTTVIALSLVGTAAATIGSRNITADYSDIKITLNGTRITPTDANGNEVEPFAVNGTTYLPVRAIANALGIYAYWDANTNTVTLTDYNSTKLNYMYQDTGIPRLDNVIGQDKYFDFFDLGDGKFGYLYLSPYERYKDFYEVNEVYSVMLLASGCGNGISGKNQNGEPYVFYTNNETGNSVYISQTKLENGEKAINVIVEKKEAKNAETSGETGWIQSGGSGSSNVQQGSSGTEESESWKDELYKQAYIDKRMAEKAAREKYGPEIPESVLKGIELDYQNRLKEIDNM